MGVKMARRAAWTAVALLGAGFAVAQEADPNHPAYWGAPSVDGGKCCASLAEVRLHIDRIDRDMIALMAERGKYVAEAGRFKKDPAAVSAPGRVEAIIARVRKTAEADGLAPEVADKTYRAMIAAFEDYERAEWGKGAPAPAK
jgi:isochorismate pyruvate lyase